MAALISLRFRIESASPQQSPLIKERSMDKKTTTIFLFRNNIYFKIAYYSMEGGKIDILILSGVYTVKRFDERGSTKCLK